MIYMENKLLSVKNYECVMLLENNMIEIKMTNDTLKITGANLEIRYYSDQEVIIYGKIDCLRFL